jgi:hypothetical protein
MSDAGRWLDLLSELLGLVPQELLDETLDNLTVVLRDLVHLALADGGPPEADVAQISRAYTDETWLVFVHDLLEALLSAETACPVSMFHI